MARSEKPLRLQDIANNEHDTTADAKYVLVVGTDGTALVSATGIKVTNPDGTTIGGTGGTSATDGATFTEDSTATTPASVHTDNGKTRAQRGDFDGIQYTKEVLGRITQLDLPLSLQNSDDKTTAKQVTDRDYLVDDIQIIPDADNVDAFQKIGDSSNQYMRIYKEASNRPRDPLAAGAQLPEIYLLTSTTAADLTNVFGNLADRPAFREFLQTTIMRYSQASVDGVNKGGGGYWDLRELSGAYDNLGMFDGKLTQINGVRGHPGVFGRGVDLDGTGDFIRQTTEDSHQGVLTGVGSPTFTLDDASQDFSDWNDGTYWLIMRDTTGSDWASAYIGTSDPDGDGTKVQLYTTSARDVLGIANNQTGFDLTDVDQYYVLKEIHTVSGWVAGINVVSDDVTSGALISMFGGDANTHTSLLVFQDTGGVLTMRVINGSTITDTSSDEALKVGRRHQVSAEFVPSTAIRLYLNGHLVAENTTSIPATMNQPLDPIAFGSHRTLGSNSAKSDSDVRISHPFYIPVAAGLGDNWHRMVYELSRR